MTRIPALVLVCVAVAACASKREVAHDARLVEVHTQLAGAYLQRNQLDVAEQEIKKALDVDPDNALANNVMALLQVRLKNDAKADSYFRKAVARDSANGDIQNNYGAFLCERGRYDEAETRFRKAIDDPRYKTPELANLNAGLCLMKKPAPARAEKYFRAALGEQPKLATALLQMSRISLNGGQALSARGYMERYLEVGKEDPEVLMLACDIERALGNKALYNNYAQRLMVKFPDSPQAQSVKRYRGK